MIHGPYDGNGHVNGNGDNTTHLRRAYASQLVDIRTAESDAAEVFPDLALAADDEALAAALRTAASETEIQLARIDRLIDTLELPVGAEPDGGGGPLDAARSLVGARRSEERDDPDEPLLRLARQALRYQIAGYEAACATARRIGDYRTLDVLLLSLDEELALDASFSDIAARRSHLLRAI